MSSGFINKLTTNDARTENAMPAHSHSGSSCLDLFFNLGTRNIGVPEEVRLFTLALREDPQAALKILFYNRDVRGGRGERDSFRRLLALLAGIDHTIVNKVSHLVPFYGRWDDLHSLIGTPSENVALALIRHALTEGQDALCAKWTPRKGDVAAKVRAALGLSPKPYRKLLVGLTKVVEQQMCAKQWGEINYSHVPSRASMIYAKAFNRHDEARYSAWREELAKPKEERDPKVKVNVGVLYPHEIVHRINDASYPVEEAWKALGEMFPPTAEKIIAVCDVSGSMTGLPMEVSVSLGIFLSERLTGPFRDMFLTFSEHPRLQRLAGGLADKVRQLEKSEWGMNTNLEAVFRLIADAARGEAQEDVPTHVLILSDMQFDECVERPSDNAMAMIDRIFEERGVRRPSVVFWNLRAVSGTLPVKMHQSGAALVSGFSPSVLKTLINHPGEFTPLGVMRSTLADPRYDALNVL